MLSKGRETLTNGAFLLSAVMAWMLSALLLLVLATVCANMTGMGEQGLGYLSSLLSFLSAAAAGFTAARKRKSRGPATVLLTATALVILLLTCGFLVDGREMNPSSILSLVSFTYTGVLFGAVILCQPKKPGRKAYPHFAN